MDRLAPFIPKDAELRNEIAREYLEKAGYLADLQQEDALPNSSVPDARGLSGSNWGNKEVNAVRAVPLVNLDMKRVVPGMYFPAVDNELFSSLCKDIGAAEIDDLKSFDDGKFLNNRYDRLFYYLSELCTTQTSEDSINRAHQRKISDSSNTTDLSTSSNEVNQENASRHALVDFILATLKNMEDYKCLPSNRHGVKPHLKCFVSMSRFKWKMGGAQYDVQNDGSIGLNFPGRNSGSDRRSDAPVVSLECKPRNAGGVKRGSGEPGQFIPAVFAQEVAELIGSMQKQQSIAIKHPDQESFVISLHGTLFHITAAYFSPEYIEYLSTGGRLEMDMNETFLLVRQSVILDLKDPQQRKNALRSLWALVRYIVSGEARVNIITAAMDASSG